MKNILTILIIGLMAHVGYASQYYNKYSSNGNACAVAYDHEDGYGRQLVVSEGSRLADLSTLRQGNWHNRISSLKVKRGCYLTAYQYLNFDIDYDSGYPLRGFINTYVGYRGHRHHYDYYGRSHYSHHDRWTWYYDLGSYENSISSLMCFCN